MKQGHLMKEEISVYIRTVFEAWGIAKAGADRMSEFDMPGLIWMQQYLSNMGSKHNMGSDTPSC